MNLKTLLFDAFMTFNFMSNSTSASHRYGLPMSEAGTLTSIANEARSDVAVPAARMQHVVWNYTMQDSLQQAVQTTNKSWWFDANQNTSRFNLEALMQFEPFKSNYPGWGFLFHDSCQDGEFGITRIFLYRAIRQRPYFDYDHCNATGFTQNQGSINSYMSCTKEHYPEVAKRPYSWVWQYMPALLLENTTEIACALLGMQGALTTKGGAPNHFMCFRNHATVQVNEQPYKAGVSCSECEPEQTCINRLCI